MRVDQVMAMYVQYVVLGVWIYKVCMFIKVVRNFVDKLQNCNDATLDHVVCELPLAFVFPRSCEKRSAEQLLNKVPVISKVS